VLLVNIESHKRFNLLRWLMTKWLLLDVVKKYYDAIVHDLLRKGASNQTKPKLT
jgi:hypothetical protein